MHISTQEELKLRAKQNEISSGEEDGFSDSNDECDPENYNFYMSQIDFAALANGIAQDDQKGQEINLRERVSTQQLRQEVNQVNQHISGNHQNITSVPNPIKLLVSKQKRRYNYNGFNLDLTYITEKIIAMGFPAENLESIYRNSMQDVRRFFDSVHPGHYKVYNLCEERKYDHSNFNQVAEFPFQDHQAPTFSLIYEFCIDLDNWLKAHEKNVAGIHCKAGKGRTGVMICCYMLYAKQFANAYDSMRYYGMIRTKNKKGVTIPSQIRYIFYFEKALNNKWVPDNMPNKQVELVKIRLIPVPNVNFFGGCAPWFRIQNKDKEYNSKNQFPVKEYKLEPYIEFKLKDIFLQGDFLLQFLNQGFLSGSEKLFQAWFNCDFFDYTGVLMIDKFMLDKACKDKSGKTFQKDFRIELHVVEVNQDNKSLQSVYHNSMNQITHKNFGF
ncbi:unnamed protein product [Paramecium sonneborni]|uniref:Phosphatidylinositol-3,4,5-trisphosphate 3-phosphatase n=1 Tax=Paramecium sonneborni TaxID=65129 RepID=A0A8S1P7Y8_9CILI|nr:unnamed protein product [Paramecium sonneborni]